MECRHEGIWWSRLAFRPRVTSQGTVCDREPLVAMGCCLCLMMHCLHVSQCRAEMSYIMIKPDG